MMPSTVLQLGPEPGTSGGMASVIEEFLRLPINGYRMEPVPTWNGRRGLRSLGTVTRALLRMIATRNRWSIAHLHLSEFGSFVREGSLAICARLLRRPVVISLHGAMFPEHTMKHPRLTRFILSQASTVLCLGEFQEAIVKSLDSRIHCTVISNPIGQTSLIEDNDPTRYVFFAGEIGSRKGVDRIIKAWPIINGLVPDARLQLAGPIADIDARKLPGRISYLGELDREEVRDRLRAASVVVLPSRAEVLPMVVLEALSVGTPVVYTRVGEWTWFADNPSVDLIAAEESDDNLELVDAVTRRLLDPVTHSQREQTAQRLQSTAGYVSVGNTLMCTYSRALETNK